MSSTNKIVTIDASKARAEFFKILDDVYQGKKSYVIQKSGVPMVQVTAVISPEERKKNIMKFAGIWKDLDTETILIDIEKVKQAGSKTKFWWEE